MSNQIDIRPDPRILAAITHNPLKPINALCELIDNSMDAFKTAEDNGINIENPYIQITLPKPSDVAEGIGKLVIEDNGPGLSLDQAQKAVTAGFSGNRNPLDNLGLFGMGFNIATGKLGQKTTFTTSRTQDEKNVNIVIDIPLMISNNSFSVPVEETLKPKKNTSGTKITIENWWKHGDMNYGFIEKLIKLGRPGIRESIGRIYYPLLNGKIKIYIDGEECPRFNHCVWSEKRFVIRKKHGEIPAQFKINESVGSEIRCNECWELLVNSNGKCPSCGMENTGRTIDKRITGWVGIQRFDDKDHFGIDLIRKGRVIRQFEKEAFFTWLDEKGQKVTDYPIDNPYGRIIGEIHLDFVPVDYLKTDFQRTSPEWADAMKILRGESSLQPERAQQNNEPENNSYIYKLFQGYRKVRTPGTTDLYMGYWNASEGKPERIDRETEREYYEKFKQGIPGYGIKDDEEWWKLVEAADQRTPESVKECDECGTQNTISAEQCISCNKILIGKKCNKCGAEITASALICNVCDQEQYGTLSTAWRCNSCGKNNPPSENKCRFCSLARGAQDTFSLNFLKENSNKVDKLSIDNFSIPLPGGINMPTIKLSTYYVKGDFKFQRDKISLPVITYINSSEVNIFIDPKHIGINSFQDRPEDYISMEIAKYIIDMNTSKINETNLHLWSISSIYYIIHNTIWRDHIELSPQETRNQIDNFFQTLYQQLPNLLMNECQDIYENYDSHSQSLIQGEMIRNNVNQSKFEEYIKSGEYLKYIPERFIIKLIEKYPGNFFDNNFWTDDYGRLSIPDENVLKEAKDGIVRKYLDCLNDLITYKFAKSPDSSYTQKVNQSLKIITSNIFNAE